MNQFYRTRYAPPQPAGTACTALPLVVVLTIMVATGLGLFIPLLGIESWLLMLAIVATVTILVSTASIWWNALHGKPWALVGYLAITVFLIDATVRRRDISAQSLDFQSILKIAVWIGGMVIAIYATPKIFQRIFKGDIKWLALYSVFALGGTLYSVSPAYTFGAGVAAVAYCLMAASLTILLTQRQILYGLLVGLIIFLGLSLMLYFILGWGMADMEGGTVRRLAGIAGSPNSLGRAASLTILVIAVLCISHRVSIFKLHCLIPLVMAVMCLFMSDSRTPVLASLVGFVMYCFRKRLWLGASLLVLLYPLAFIVLNVDIRWNDLAVVFSRTGRASELLTFTGRTEIWHAVWEAFLKKPFLGYGFGSTKVLIPEIYSNYWGFTVTQAHNFLLQVLVTTGLIGAGLIFMLCYRQIAAYIRNPQIFSTVVFFFMLAYGITEAGPSSPAPNTLLFFWALGICWSHAKQDIEGHM